MPAIPSATAGRPQCKPAAATPHTRPSLPTQHFDSKFQTVFSHSAPQWTAIFRNSSWSLDDIRLVLSSDPNLALTSSAPWRKSHDQPRQHIKKQKTFALPAKVHLVEAMLFSSSHVWMWELDYKESWAPKNWGFWTVVLEKTLESPLDCKEIQPVNPKGNQSWIFIWGTDAKAETPVLWPPDVKNQLIGKYPDAGKDWRREEKGMTEDEMVGWHDQCYGHEFE